MLWDALKEAISENDLEDVFDTANLAGELTGTADTTSAVRFLMTAAYTRRVPVACIIDLIKKEGIHSILPHPLGLSSPPPPQKKKDLGSYWDDITKSNLALWLEPYSKSFALSAPTRAAMKQQVIVALSVPFLDLCGPLRSFLVRNNDTWVLSVEQTEVAIAFLCWLGTSEGFSFLTSAYQEVGDDLERLRSVLLLDWEMRNRDDMLLNRILNEQAGSLTSKISDETRAIARDIVLWLGSIAGIWLIKSVLRWEKVIAR